ncbi:MAG: hypothetical protein QGF90_01915 [Gammaproteobacteria bacterium]|nr:hypothetical protein [Gammaproteobacteria bacterium]
MEIISNRWQSLPVAGIENRQMVKDFFTIAMGASDRGGAQKACQLEGISKKEFEQIETASLRRFPELTLFKGFGIHAQNLEGQILKQVMLEGVDNDIVALPVHDAVAVVHGNEEWATEAMLKAWTEHTNSTGSDARSRVKVDYPD